MTQRSGRAQARITCHIKNKSKHCQREAIGGAVWTSRNLCSLLGSIKQLKTWEENMVPLP